MWAAALFAGEMEVFKSVWRGSSVTLKISTILLVQRDSMVKVNIPKLLPAHAWW